MYPWREMYSTSTYSSTLLFSPIQMLFECVLWARNCTSLWGNKQTHKQQSQQHMYVYISHCFFLQDRDSVIPVYCGKYVGEGNGTPLQYSCLENPMGGGAWKAAVHGVAKSRTRLSDFLSLFTFMHWRRKWQPTPVFLPGESQGWGSLVGFCLWGRTESGMTEVT